jgi:hypothetical protein
MFVGIGGIVDHQWSTIPPISPQITSTHWVIVNNSTKINKNHLSPQLIEWWSTIPPISTKITSLNEFRWEVIFVDIGGIVNHHSMSWSERWFLLILVELLTSLNDLMWEVIFVDIGGIVDHHSMSLGERWFLLILVETNINKNHLSPQFIEWCQQFHQYQQKSPLSSTHWMMVNNSTNINQNHPSLQLIEWWSTIPPISTKITSLLNSLSDGQQFHQYQQTYWLWNCWPSLNELKWEVVFVEIGGIVGHHSMSWGERWF